MANTKLKILFSGMIAGTPYQGGATWAVLQYVLGLKELGHEVLLVEPINPASIQPSGVSLIESANSSYFCDVMDEFGLTRRSALLLEGTQETVGLSYDAIVAFARQADLLINVSGMLADPELIAGIPTRAYLDLDPAFIQFWHAAEGIDMRFDAHTHFVTIGLAIGSKGSDVPNCGRQWITTLQPISLPHWPLGKEITHDALTTVGNWRAYGSMNVGGITYGQKVHSLREFIELPRRTSERFLLAMAIHPKEATDLAALEQNGWQLIDPQEVCRTPTFYQRFIRGSKAEFGIAKSGYVKSRCGWFSDRSVCYLAAGRPVIAQETGFSDYLPTGAGLLSFTSLNEAKAAIERLNEDYAGHSKAARELAETHFSSSKVLSRLLDRLGATA